MVIKLPMRKTRKWTPPAGLGPTRASCAPVAGGGQGPGGAAGGKGAARCGRQPEGSHSRARAAPRAPRGSRGSRGVCKVPKEKTHSSRCHKTALLRARPLRFGYEANSRGRGSPQTAPPLLRALPLPRGPQAPTPHAPSEEGAAIASPQQTPIWSPAWPGGAGRIGGCSYPSEVVGSTQGAPRPSAAMNKRPSSKRRCSWVLSGPAGQRLCGAELPVGAAGPGPLGSDACVRERRRPSRTGELSDPGSEPTEWPAACPAARLAPARAAPGGASP